MKERQGRSVSRILFSPDDLASDDHSSGPDVVHRDLATYPSRPSDEPRYKRATFFQRAERVLTLEGGTYLVLLRWGLPCLRRRRTERWAFTPPFHPYLSPDDRWQEPSVNVWAIGGLFSVALSVSDGCGHRSP